MKHPLRFSDGLDSKNNKISIVCNDLKIGAEEISDLYRSRWQIELFIKWIKQHLVIKKLYGTSQNAVFNQIYLAMITYCLTLLMKNKYGYKGNIDRKSTRLNSSHVAISYAVFCLKKKTHI